MKIDPRILLAALLAIIWLVCGLVSIFGPKGNDAIDTALVATVLIGIGWIITH